MLRPDFATHVKSGSWVIRFAFLPDAKPASFVSFRMRVARARLHTSIPVRS